MRNLLIVMALLTVSLESVVPAAAKDVYVNNTSGDDRLAASRAAPVRTIQRALDLAEPGDRIVLTNTAAPYHESISLVGSRHSGSAVAPFVLDGGGAILDGSAPVPPRAWKNYRGPVFRFRPLAAEFQQLLLGGRPLPRVIADPRQETPPKLEPLQWCLHRAEIYFCVEPAKLPDQYSLRYAQLQTGITLFHVRQVVIQDLIVQHFRIDGINAFNSARQVSLVRVTGRGNGRAGVTVGGDSLARVEQCLLGNNGHAQLLTLPLSETAVEGAELLSNTAPGWIDAGGAVYFNGKRVAGGLEEFRPAATP